MLSSQETRTLRCDIGGNVIGTASGDIGTGIPDPGLDRYGVLDEPSAGISGSPRTAPLL